jgi:hypothetical protein
VIARFLALVVMLTAHSAYASPFTDALADCDVLAAKKYNDVESDRLLSEMQQLVSDAKVISQRRSDLATSLVELSAMSPIEQTLKSATNPKYSRARIDAQDEALANQLNTILLKSKLIELEMQMLSSEVNRFTQKCGSQ